MTATKQKTLSSGARVLKSKRGARGFFYPDLESTLLVRKECYAIPQTGWNTYSGYAAYVVPSNVFASKDRYCPETSKMIIWALVEDITLKTS